MSRFRPLTFALSTAVACLLATAARADIVTFTGNTSSGSTYNRVDVDASTALPSGVSPTGTAVNYNVYNFAVAASGNYSFTTAGTYDTFATLYGGGFDASAPLKNALTGNDDLAGIGTSGFALNLSAGTMYSYVTSGFLNGAGGFFSTTINGVGAIVPTTVTVPATDPRIVTTAGNTVGGATYDRADDAANVSTVGTSVAYRTFSFTVDAIDDYSFIANGDYDTFLSLYAGTFDPNQPLGNLVGVNDDGYDGAYAGFNQGFLSHVSAFDATLTPGRTYTLVTSGYDNDSAGVYGDTIVGAKGGLVSAVGPTAAIPEPGVVALMFLGIGMMSIFVRRRWLSPG